MRKLLCALTTMLLMTGLVVAGEVMVTSYNKDTKTLKVKDGDAEKEYKITDKTTVTVLDKDGNATEGKLDDLTRRLERTGKDGKDGGGKGRGGPLKLDITTDGDAITAVKMKARRGKGKN